MSKHPRNPQEPDKHGRFDPRNHRFATVAALMGLIFVVAIAIGLLWVN